MLKIFVSSAFIFSLAISLHAQVKMPAPSSTQTIKQDFALGSIELTYSRPNAKDRKIYGDLVPYNKIWRTGANAATRIRFSDPVEIGGKKFDSGTYVIYTMPGIDNWTIIFNKGINNWGTEGYKETEDVIRFKTEPAKLKNKLETFTMQFTDIKPESCELHIIWAKTDIRIAITANIKERLRTQIETALQSDKKPYWQAAQFYNEYDNNKTKALDNCNKAIMDNPKAYWIYLYKAKIQKDLADNSGAIQSSKKSLELAKEEKNDDYIKMNEALLKELK
ncbi:MAG: DUF2911 domain-containing protein [Ferruginibacter sp.]